jgi:hypothetical protein
MDQPEFDELLTTARQIATILRTVFRDVTDEESELEALIRHFPLVAIGLAAGTGTLVGWWIGRKRRELPSGESAKPLNYLQRILPAGSLDRVRDAVPEPVRDEAAAAAKAWVDNVLEPRLKQGLETVAASVAETRLGVMFREIAERMEQDVRLDDHQEPEPGQ